MAGHRKDTWLDRAAGKADARTEEMGATGRHATRLAP